MNRLLSAKEVRGLLGDISKMTLWRMVQRGEITTVRISPGRVGYPEDQIKAICSGKHRGSTRALIGDTQ